MAHVLIPLPAEDFDPSEAAISWAILTRDGHRVSFATPQGEPGEADPIMLSGRGLDPWSNIPFLGEIRLVGLMLRANADARRAYAAMSESPEFAAPLPWADAKVEDFDAALLPGGHCARGMREYLESELLQMLVADFFAASKPVAAICHGVLLAARSRRADGRSVLHGRKTTALTWKLERAADRIARKTRFWDPAYYRTYVEAPGEPEGFMSVEQEVSRHLASPDDFLDASPGDPHFRRKTSGLARDASNDETPAFVVRDGVYVSARWPGDAHTFAKTFSDLLPKGGSR